MYKVTLRMALTEVAYFLLFLALWAPTGTAIWVLTH